MAEVKTGLRFTATLGKTPKDPPRTLLLELDLSAPVGVRAAVQTLWRTCLCAGWLVG